MSTQFEPDQATAKRYDREADQLVKYISGKDSKGVPDPFWVVGNERFADIASLPTFRALDKKLAEQGEP